MGQGPSAPFQGGPQQQPQAQAPGFQGGFPGGQQGGMPQGMAPGGMMPGMMPGGMGQMPDGMQQMPGGMGQMPGGMQQMPPSGAPIGPDAGMGQNGGVPFEEESYIENILRLNRGKMATVYMTFENNTQWNAKVFKGIIEAAGRDHIVLSDPQTGRRYLLLMIYLDYVTFDEELEYQYPFA
ncbi:spore coat protein GerQ [Salinibacillus xinjiangensis]